MTTTNDFSGTQLDWQQPLKDRHIFNVALEAGWYYEPIFDQREHGWAYPIHNLDEEFTGIRWKNINGSGNPKYFWLEKQTDETRFPYYILPGTLEAVRENEGRIFLANGEPALLSYRAAGLLNSFCTLNGETAIPGDILYILKQLGVREVVYFFDNDDTGERAARRVGDVLIGTDTAYRAVRLPGDMPGKADVNDWWMARSGSPSIFQQELYYVMDSPGRQYINQPANTPVPAVSEHIEIRRSTEGIRTYDDLPHNFYDAIIQHLMTDYGLKQFKHNGFSNNCRCPHHEHEHDATRPAGAWNLHGRFFTCHKCGRTYNAIETGQALGLDWHDFIERKRGKRTPKPRNWYAESRRQRRQMSDEELMSSISNLIDEVDSGKYYLMPVPDGDIAGVLNVLKSHSVLYGRIRHLKDDILQNLLDRTEQGDALLTREIFMDKLLYDYDENCWYTWQGHHWQKDTRDTIAMYVMEYLSSFYREKAVEYYTRYTKERGKYSAAYLKDMADELSERAKSVSGRAYARRVADTLAYYVRMKGTWDHNPYLLGVQNGVVDLKKGEFRHGRPEDYIRTVSPVAYDPEAAAPNFEKFILEILGDEEKVEFVRRLFGYGMSGLNREHILPILYGQGRNGKDTLLNVLSAVLGQMASPGFNEVLISTGRAVAGRATPEIYDLAGKRIVWASESADTAKLNVHQVKQLTGSETIRARPLYGHPVEFKSTHLLMLSTNHLPELPSKEEDYAIWQRLLIVEFPYSFVENPQEEMERPIDKALPDKLTEELPGILNWLIMGFMAYQRANSLQPPESVRMSTNAAERDSDTMGGFLSEICVREPDATIPAARFYDAYLAWAKQQQTGRPLTRTKFGRMMSKKFKKTHTVTGKVYSGVRLKD